MQRFYTGWRARGGRVILLVVRSAGSLDFAVVGHECIDVVVENLDVLVELSFGGKGVKVIHLLLNTRQWCLDSGARLKASASNERSAYLWGWKTAGENIDSRPRKYAVESSASQGDAGRRAKIDMQRVGE